MKHCELIARDRGVLVDYKRVVYKFPRSPSLNRGRGFL